MRIRIGLWVIAALAAIAAARASAGSDKLLHGFAGNKHGSRPAAGLIRAGLLNVGGTLYGTTYGAGTDNGTVFAYTL